MTYSEYALKFIGTPYKWGGESPEQGYDCSGFMQEVLASQGADPDGDQAAQGLYNYFCELRYQSNKPRKDCILFFGESEKSITHTALAINSHQMIEAAGEGRISTDLGFIRIRPIKSRLDLIASFQL